MLSYYHTAIRRHLPDFIDMMLATSLWIGQTAAIQWPSVDLEHGTIELRQLYS